MNTGSSLLMQPAGGTAKPNLPPRAAFENCAATRWTGSSFVDPGNLDEIDDASVDDEGYVPDCPSQDRIEGRFQQRYVLMLKRRVMAGMHHTSHGHCNNRQTNFELTGKVY